MVKIYVLGENNGGMNVSMEKVSEENKKMAYEIGEKCF